MPAEDRVGGDDQMKSPECGAGEPVQQGGEEYAVGRSEPGFGDLALKDGQLWRRVRISTFLSVSLIGSSRRRANTLVSVR